MIYLDNAASALIYPKAINFTPEYGNPSSEHLAGYQAKNILEMTRKTASTLFGGSKENYYFCSGATESANIIISGICHHLYNTKSIRNEIIVSVIEHPAVFNTVNNMKKLGFNIHVIPVSENGVILENVLLDKINKRTAMVLVMGVNNETGAVQPVNNLSYKVKKIDNEVLFISDSVQSLTKAEHPDVKYIDAFFSSGHKLGATKGIGFFYINDKIRLSPTIFGGNQESGVRPGTENLFGIQSLYYALLEYQENDSHNYNHIVTINNLLREKLSQLEINHSFNTPQHLTSSYIISLRLDGIYSSELIAYLSKNEICVSRGSACSSLSITPSRVLSAMSLTRQQINSTIRISFSTLNTREEIIKFCRTILDYTKLNKNHLM